MNIQLLIIVASAVFGIVSLVDVFDSFLKEETFVGERDRNLTGAYLIFIPSTVVFFYAMFNNWILW